MSAIADAAARAPTGAGVYFLLDASRELVYVGKAANLRRRLQQHARAARERRTPRDILRGELVTDVAWEECADEVAAASREADLVVAFAPLLNASYATDGRWTNVVVAIDRLGDTVTFQLAPTPPVGPNRVYGCFPHLGVGVASPRAIACSEGYSALLRLVWAACDPDAASRHPAAIAGPSPPAEARLPYHGELTPVLHRFLAGTSRRLVDTLLDRAAEVRPAFMLPALRRDRDAALAFFEHGPRALRELRLRHGVAAGPLAPGVIRDLLGSELRALIGDVVLPEPDVDEARVGARLARQHANRQALRRRKPGGGEGRPGRRG